MTDSYTNVKGRSQERSLPAPVNPNGEGTIDPHLALRRAHLAPAARRPSRPRRRGHVLHRAQRDERRGDDPRRSRRAGPRRRRRDDDEAARLRPRSGRGDDAPLPRLHRVEIVTAPTGATTDNWAAQLDTGTTRYSSGGTALTIVNPNMQSSNTSMLAATSALLGGAVVVGAEGANVRELGHGQIRSAIRSSAIATCSSSAARTTRSAAWSRRPRAVT
jgi:hypothetical protein